jgi:hypothetical protein
MRLSVTGLLSLVVAVSAATLADPLVEYASNSGFFGVGSFTDHSTINVVPAAITALGLAAAYVVFLARRSFASTRGAVRRLPSARLPVTFGLQMLVLFGMESLEQLVVVGHPLGGSVWLGGPIVVALLVHALACVGLSFLLSRVLASLADVAAQLASSFTAFASRVTAAACVATRPATAWRYCASEHPLASRSGKRAPPNRFR